MVSGIWCETNHSGIYMANDEPRLPIRPSSQVRRRTAEGEHPVGAFPGLGNLYRAAGLLFLFALLYSYFGLVAQTFLLAYAAAILAVALNVIVRLFPFRRGWGAALIGVLAVAGVAAALWLGVPVLLAQVRDMVASGPVFLAEFEKWGEQVRRATGLNLPLANPHATAVVRNLFGSLSGAGVLSGAASVVQIAFVPLVIFFGAIFAVARPNDHLITGLLRAVPRERRPAFRRMFELLGARLAGWIRGVLLAMLTVGALASVVFYVVGVPHALLLGVVNGLTEFVPLLGPWAGGAVATVVAFVYSPTLALWTALGVLVIQQLESNVVHPLVMARVADIHPFLSLFSLILFGGMFGFLGIFLALPLVLLVWTVVEVLWVEQVLDADEDRIRPVVDE